MDNLSNALFLLEASDSFISFANFFAQILLCIQKYVRLTFELEKMGELLHHILQISATKILFQKIYE